MNVDCASPAENPFDIPNDIIFYSHLGLGDQIICIGLANFLSKKHPKVYVPTKSQYFEMMKYCYKDNPKIDVYEVCKYNEYVGCPDSTPGVKDLKEETKLEVFESGHSNMGYPFNTAFYENNGIPYSVSFDYFSLPEEGEEDDAMFDHLMETYNISGDYAVVSNEFSGGNFDLKVESKYPLVYLKQSEDLYRNIFFYKKIIRKAKELHLVNSAYFHLAERLPKDGKIHYHNDRGQDFSFYRQDDIVLA